MSAQFDEVMELFRQTDRKMAESHARFKEEVAAQAKEAERRAAEFTAQLQESAKQAAERAAEADKRFAERAAEADQRAAERAAEADKRFAETERIVKRVSQDIGRLGNRLGEWVEATVKPAAVRLFRERGVDVRQVIGRSFAQEPDGTGGIEVDLFVIDGTEAVAVECKSELSTEDVQDHVERMGKVKRLMPQYGAYRLMGAVAGTVVSDNVAKYAAKQGLFVLVPKGEDVTIANEVGFVAKAW